MNINTLIAWVLTSSFWQRKLTAIVAVGVVKFFGAGDDTVTKTAAIVYLIDSVISHFIGRKMQTYAESPSPAPWVQVKPATPIVASTSTGAPTGLGPLHH